MLTPIRHACGVRLFDSLHTVEVFSGPSPDLAIKCPRCSRNRKGNVIAKFKFKLPRWIGPTVPDPIYCGNLQCNTRLCDLSLPYTQVENFGDIQIKCPKCGDLTSIELRGIAQVGEL